jgi:UDP-glucose 4-epimerase
MHKPLVIVTGGCGYIGSHTVVDLIESGYDVVSIDNFLRSGNYALSGIRKITGKKVINHEVNLCDYEATRKVFDSYPQITGVIHFAAVKSVPESVRNPLLYYQNNIDSLVNVLKCVHETEIKNLVFSSSCSVYGDIESLPVSESTPLSAPKSPYAYTKVVGERIVADAANAYGFNAINLRYFNPVGAHTSGLIGELPLQRPDNLVPVITQTAIGKIPKLTVFGGEFATRDGSCVRDYVHVMDIAKAHTLALELMFNSKNLVDTINLGSGQGVTVLEAIKTFERISSIRLNYEIGAPRDGDVIEIYSDSTKAKQKLNWLPQHDINSMIETAWKWQLYLDANNLMS